MSPRRERGQMGVFMLVAVPAFTLVLMFANDAASIMSARSAADDFAVAISRYIAADSALVACDVNVTFGTAGGCTGRARTCASGTGAVPWGRWFLDGAVVRGYDTMTPIGGELRDPLRPGFDDLVRRLPQNVVLSDISASLHQPGGAGTAAAVQVTVSVIRSRLLSERLLGLSRTSTVDATAVSTMYVENLSGSGRAVVTHTCAAP